MSRPLQQQISEVAREIALRKNVYPGLVGRGKMRQSEADEHLARIDAALLTLNGVERATEALRQYRRDMQFPDLDDGQRQRRIEAIDQVLVGLGVTP